MPKRVQLPNGQVGEFPDSMSQEQIEAVLQRQFPKVSASPSPLSPAGIKSRLMTARDTVIDNLPSIGGFFGGMVGLGAGAETGPGALATSAVGAAAGGGLGEDAKQSLTEHFHPEDRQMGPLESGLRILAAGGEQGLQEVGGQVAGRVAGKIVRPLADKAGPAILAKYPILKDVFAVGEGASPRAAQHLTAAAANKQTAGVTLEAVGNTLGDLESEITKLPPKERTVEGFLKSVNSRKDAMNAESGAAMLPIAGQQTVPQGVSQNIQGLIRSYMQNTPMGRSQRGYLAKRAAEFQKPWTYRQLDELRTDLASSLAKHNAKLPVAKYTAEKGDLDVAIDSAVLDGLRDTVYPEMDRAAGKPAGYFENLKGRQSSLIALQEILDKRLRDLSGAQAISEVTPRLGSENISLSAHAGSLPRAGVYGIRQAISPNRELKSASKHVAKAFPAVDSLPYQVLFSGETRAATLKGPKQQELEKTADDARNGQPTHQ